MKWSTFETGITTHKPVEGSTGRDASRACIVNLERGSAGNGIEVLPPTRRRTTPRTGNTAREPSPRRASARANSSPEDPRSIAPHPVARLASRRVTGASTPASSCAGRGGPVQGLAFSVANVFGLFLKIISSSYLCAVDVGAVILWVILLVEARGPVFV